MIIIDAMRIAKEGLIAESEDLSFQYIPERKTYRFNREYTREDLFKQWSMRWPTKKESSIWLKK